MPEDTMPMRWRLALADDAGLSLAEIVRQPFEGWVGLERLLDLLLDRQGRRS